MRFLLIFFVITFPTLILAQSNSQFQPPFTIKHIQEKITIDGKLDENIWTNGPTTSKFWQYFPSDSMVSKYQTEIFMAYDDAYIYVAAKCYSNSNKFVIPSYRRDYRAGGNDNVTFVFDTFSDNTNAFVFGMNPYGVMREALISNGGTDNTTFNTFWDNKWNGASKIYDGYWICELAIPFSTLRFKEGIQTWKFNSYRFDTQTNETTSWNRIPQNQIVMNLAFTSDFNFEKPLKKTGANISVIPYLRTGLLTDYQPSSTNTSFQKGLGADVKVGVTPGLNLDLTVNPDFSQVESDRQIQNLSRFDISYSYPEQRQFFLENSDLFSSFGNQYATPFFSRQIGLAVDTVTNLYTPNSIQYGARLSGKIDNNWRVGLMNLQTGSDLERGISSANFSVFAIQRKFAKRSNISALLVNKETLSPEINKKLQPYNRAAAIEYNLASADNTWNGKFYYHTVMTPSLLDEKAATGTQLTYSKRKILVNWQHDWVGKGYDAEVGFVPRKNIFHINPFVQLNYYPRTKFINRYSFGVMFDQVNILNERKTDQFYGIYWTGVLQNSARFTVNLSRNFTYLFNAFDPTRSKNEALKAGESFKYTNLQFEYFSDQRKVISTTSIGTIGQYFDGTIASMVGSVIYRFQPKGNITLNYSYSHIESSKGKGNLFLIGPRADITFNKNLFWTTFLQYNSLINNININSRIQYRYKPVSDFYLVYTDNYSSESWMPKNRAILAKITYWLNI
jgi:hypothetical protein